MCVLSCVLGEIFSSFLCEEPSFVWGRIMDMLSLDPNINIRSASYTCRGGGCYLDFEDRYLIGYHDITMRLFGDRYAIS